MIWGVDYGSKMAGTTVVAAWNGEAVQLDRCPKKKDADAWLLRMAADTQPKHVFLDAPLSLPGVYTRLPGYEDYFYRQADREMKAMSPMFLGGLTARAMRLSADLHPTPVSEVYPGAWARHWSLKGLGYKKQLRHLPEVWSSVSSYLPFSPTSPPTNWHELDALLALYSGWRFTQGQHQLVGREEEGQILV